MGYAYFPTFSGPITSIAPTDFKKLFYHNFRISIYFFKYLFLYVVTLSIINVGKVMFLFYISKAFTIFNYIFNSY
jgi:hypothetical protein